MSTPFGSRGKGATATKTKPATKAKAAPADDDDPIAVADPDAEDGVSTDPRADAKKAAATSDDPFATPPEPSGARISDFVGELLIVKPIEETVVPTSVSPTSDAIRADVVRLDLTADDEDEDESVFVVNLDMLVFQQALRKALARVLVSSKPFMLGRLAMGNKQPGKNAPYIFLKADDDDLAKAKAWLKENPGVL